MPQMHKFISGGFLLKISLMLFLIATGFLSELRGQEVEGILTPKGMFGAVGKFHPIARQAFLIDAQQRANILAAKGAFDPVLYSDYDYKQSDAKPYYSIWQTELELPSWYGLAFKAGYSFAEGDFINPEEKLPPTGLGALGFSWTPLQGFFMDDRRAGLAQAKIFAQSTAAQQQVMFNDLLLESWGTYWDWAGAKYQVEVLENALRVGRDRFQLVRTSFQQGDVAGIDTLEALIQVQNRELELNDAMLQLQKANFLLSNFFWNSDTEPVGIPLAIEAVDRNGLDLAGSSLQKMRADINNIARQHPMVQIYNYKLADLEVTRRLKAEKLKPNLKVNYNLLGTSFDLINNNDNQGAVIPQNYKWGANFSYPLFVRDARGQLRLQELKIQETDLNRNLKITEISNKLLASYAELDITSNQVRLYAQILNNYRRLFEAETLKFQLGDSSLFLVNSRENRLIEAELKAIELLIKNRIAASELAWAIGDMSLLLD